jgi:hypothetical protein
MLYNLRYIHARDTQNVRLSYITAITGRACANRGLILHSHLRTTVGWDPSTGDLFAGFGVRFKPPSALVMVAHGIPLLASDCSPFLRAHVTAIVVLCPRSTESLDTVRERNGYSVVFARKPVVHWSVHPHRYSCDPGRPRRPVCVVLRWCNIHDRFKKPAVT